MMKKFRVFEFNAGMMALGPLDYRLMRDFDLLMAR